MSIGQNIDVEIPPPLSLLYISLLGTTFNCDEALIGDSQGFGECRVTPLVIHRTQIRSGPEQ